jgi:hypothetical protein
VSIDVTEDPTPTPGFAVFENYEGTPIPRNGIGIHFSHPDCGTANLVTIFDDYRETDFERMGGPCVTTGWGKLNRVVVRVSRTRIEVLASDASDDGVTFGPMTSVFSADVSLPFSRGYVHITTHNHASLKYTEREAMDGFRNLDAWIARVDNVGFDGPVVENWREVDVANSHAPVEDGYVNLGWRIPDAAMGTSDALTIPNVELAGVTSARLAATVFYCIPCGDDPAAFNVRYRVNAGPWHDRMLSAGEISGVTSGSGCIDQMFDVPVGELREGENRVELASVGVPQSYPPGLANVSLIMER